MCIYICDKHINLNIYIYVLYVTYMFPSNNHQQLTYFRLGMFLQFHLQQQSQRWVFLDSQWLKAKNVLPSTIFE